jgi:DNA-3-methyladenine glycosylase
VIGKTQRARNRNVGIEVAMSRNTELCEVTPGWEQLPTDQLAVWLLGKALLRRMPDGWIGGIIVETEAYLSQGDPACHAARGCTKRNRTMFGPPGRLYVYSIHAKWCANIVTEPPERGAAVLLRAIEPVWGLEQMRTARNQPVERDLTRGPARLCQAIGLDGRHDGLNCIGPNSVLRLAECPAQLAPWELLAGPRIGISAGSDLRLRFFVDGNRHVSGRAADHRMRPNNRLWRGELQPPLRRWVRPRTQVPPGLG